MIVGYSRIIYIRKHEDKMWYHIVGYLVAFSLTMPIMTALGAFVGAGLSRVEAIRNSIVARVVSGVFGFLVALFTIVVASVILYLFDESAGYTMPSIAGAGACLGGYSGMKSALLDEPAEEEVS